MDRDGFQFQGELLGANVPPRRPTAMPAQPIVPWTLARLTTAALEWLMAETFADPARPDKHDHQASCLTSLPGDGYFCSWSCFPPPQRSTNSIRFCGLMASIRCEFLFLALFAILFGWITISFWVAVFGAFARLTGARLLPLADANHAFLIAHRHPDAYLQRGRGAGFFRRAGDLRFRRGDWRL